MLLVNFKVQKMATTSRTIHNEERKREMGKSHWDEDSLGTREKDPRT